MESYCSSIISPTISYSIFPLAFSLTSLMEVGHHHQIRFIISFIVFVVQPYVVLCSTPHSRLSITMFLGIFMVVNVFLLYTALVDSQIATKSIVHLCDPTVPNSCGTNGVCIKKRTGNRCKCPTGFMGIRCRRPCQDVYASCDHWKSERRCDWAQPILPFFEDNCAQTCGKCQSNGRKLKLALPPILEPISWMLGRWETTTRTGSRFPVPLSGPYHEILDISIAEVPMFDRPPVNISIRAYTPDHSDEHNELGFMTGKPFHEDTGFVEFDKPRDGPDLVAVEMTGNNGLTTIEEGELKDGEITLILKYKKSLFNRIGNIKNARRIFKLENNELIEKTTIRDGEGNIKRWIKRYRKKLDYLLQY